MLGLLGLSVTYVSLWGPHSFDTSTFGPTSAEAVRPPPLIGPFWARYRYLFHQVGLCELSAGWAAASGRDGAVAPGGSWHATARTPTASAKWRVRIIDASHAGPLNMPVSGAPARRYRTNGPGAGGARVSQTHPIVPHQRPSASRGRSYCSADARPVSSRSHRHPRHPWHRRAESVRDPRQLRAGVGAVLRQQLGRREGQPRARADQSW